MASVNFGILADSPNDDEAEAMAKQYMAFMNNRCGLHCSAHATKRWTHTFKMILREHNPTDVYAVMNLLELEWFASKYTNPHTLREQFGPLIIRAAKDYPQLFVELPELPKPGAAWQKWAAMLATEWPVHTTAEVCVTALRVQLWLLRDAAAGDAIGWPVAALWLDHMRQQWAGWRAAPQPTSFSVYWRPGCKRDQQLDQFIDPQTRKKLRGTR